MAPYSSVRYHLKEQALANLRPANAKELFNLRHASLRNVIERCFGVLKKRFKVLQTPPQFPFKSQVKMIYVLCALSNFIRRKGLQQEDIFEQEGFEIDEESIGNHAGRYPSTTVSAAMTRKQDRMAATMWRDYQAHIQR